MSSGFRSETDLEDVIAIVETMELNLELLRLFLSTTNSKDYFCELLLSVQTENTKLLFSTLGC